jgi:hypothetical protein
VVRHLFDEDPFEIEAQQLRAGNQMLSLRQKRVNIAHIEIVTRKEGAEARADLFHLVAKDARRLDCNLVTVRQQNAPN